MSNPKRIIVREAAAVDAAQIVILLEELGYPELAVLGMYRLVAAPPKTPADRVKLLENALMKTLEDKDFLTWAKKANRSVYPSNGENARKILNAQAQTYEKYKEMLKKAVGK